MFKSRLLKTIKIALCAGAVTVWMMGTANAMPVKVDLELVLLNDVSGNVTTQDFDSIKQGYANAFRDTEIQAQIQSGEIGSIAISLGFISDNFQLTGGWTLIDSGAAADAFAARVEGRGSRSWAARFREESTILPPVPSTSLIPSASLRTFLIGTISKALATLSTS
jgi:hypothetical protein